MLQFLIGLASHPRHLKYFPKKVGPEWSGHPPNEPQRNVARSFVPRKCYTFWEPGLPINHQLSTQVLSHGHPILATESDLRLPHQGSSRSSSSSSRLRLARTSSWAYVAVPSTWVDIEGEPPWTSQVIAEPAEESLLSSYFSFFFSMSDVASIFAHTCSWSHSIVEVGRTIDE